MIATCKVLSLIYSQEEKKIVLYYPPKTDATTQMKTVGLSEAIIKFTQ